MAQNKKIRVGITHGDINGIGYEVIMKALEDPLMTDLCTPIVYGSSKALSYHRKALEMGNVNFTLVPRAEDAADGVNNLVEVVDGEVRIELGSPSEAAGKAALAALKRAADDLRNGIIDVMVTAPINKDSIQGDDFHFPGHTEFLESRIGEGNKALMILFDDHLRVALVTTHLPLAQVPEAITKDAIVEKLEIFNDSLKKDLDARHIQRIEKQTEEFFKEYTSDFTIFWYCVNSQYKKQFPGDIYKDMKTDAFLGVLMCRFLVDHNKRMDKIIESKMGFAQSIKNPYMDKLETCLDA